MRFLSLSVLLVLTTACGEQAIAVISSPPIAMITSHDEGATVEAGAVAMRGVVSDMDDPGPDLQTLWTVNGESACRGVPNEVGESFCEISVSPPIADVVFEARDPTGLMHTDHLNLLVAAADTAPNLTILSPSTGEHYDFEEPLLLVAAVSDPNEAADSFSVQWESSLDGSMGASPTNELGNAVFPAQLSVGTHFIVARVQDSGAQQDSDTIEVVIDPPPNHAPSIATVQITPDEPTVLDTLICEWGGWHDEDGDLNASLVSWTVNGITVGSTATLEMAFDVGDIVACTLTPYDGIDFGTAVADTVVISEPPNTPPSIGSVHLTPAVPIEGSLAFCGWTGWADADGDGDQSTLQWTVDGVPMGSAAVLSEGFAAGQTIECTVTPFDGEATGESKSTWASVAAAWSNTPGEVSNVRIEPEPAFPDDALTCHWDFADIDGDDDHSTVEWFVDGATAGTGLELDSGFGADDDVECRVTPFDGTDTGTAVSGTMTVSEPPLVGADCQLPLTFSRVLHGIGNVDLAKVRWAPDGSYALLLSKTAKLYHYDPEAGTVELVDSRPIQRWFVIEFHPDGHYALIGGNQGSTTISPVLYRYSPSDGLQQITDVTGAAQGRLPDLSQIKDIAHRPGTDSFGILSDDAQGTGPGWAYINLFEPDADSEEAWSYEGAVAIKREASGLAWGTSFGRQVALATSNDTQVITYDPEIPGAAVTVQDYPQFGYLHMPRFDPTGTVAWVTNVSSNHVYTWDGTLKRGTGFDMVLSPNGLKIRDWSVTGDGHWKIFVGRNGYTWLSDSAWYPKVSSQFYTNRIPDWEGGLWQGTANDEFRSVSFRPGTCEGLFVGDATADNKALIGRFELIP